MYIAVVNTLFHEIGHSIFALLTDGKVYSISLFTNTEGVAVTGSRFWIGRVLVSLAGYPFASFISFVSFYMLAHYPVTYFLYGLVVCTVFAFIFWIRNLYGFVWCISFVGLILLSIFGGTPLLESFFATFVAFILLTQSVSTAFVIFKLSLKQPKKAGDASNLARHTYIPAPFWGTFFFVQSLFVCYWTFILFIL